MELKKCSQCGGDLKRLRTQRAWVCPYCNARFEDAVQEKPDLKNYHGLNDEIFKVEGNLDAVIAKEGGAGCVNSIVHCMNTYQTAAQVEEYMLKKLRFSSDISVKGVREEWIQKAMPMIQSVMEPGERVIVYGNKGIFSKGKDYFVITDKRSIFVVKKAVRSVLHTDIDTLTIANCGNCTVNGDYEKNIISLDGTGTFQGALLAMMCMFAFEAQPDRDRIRIV